MTTVHLRYLKLSFIALRTDRVEPHQKSKQSSIEKVHLYSSGMVAHYLGSAVIRDYAYTHMHRFF